MFRPSRGAQGPEALRSLWLRAAVFATGAVLGIAGMAAEVAWLIYLAVGVLVLGVVLRRASR